MNQNSNSNIVKKSNKIAWKQEINIIGNKIKKRELEEKLKNEKRKKGLDRDAHNRAYISTKIRQYMQQGMEKNDAVLRVMEEEKAVIEQFKYLEKAGLDLRVVLSNWVSGGHCKTVEKSFSSGDEER